MPYKIVVRVLVKCLTWLYGASVLCLTVYRVCIAVIVNTAGCFRIKDVIFCCSWHNAFTQYYNCWVLIVYGVTVHNKSPPTLVNAWTHLTMGCRTLSKVLGRLRMVLQTADSFSPFSVGAEYTRDLYALTDKIINDWGQYAFGLCLKNCLWT